MCRNDIGGITVIKSEQPSVITTIASNNKILANSLNKLNDKGILTNYFNIIMHNIII